MTKFINSKLLIYIFFTFFSFCLRIYLFEDRNSWHDEWHSIYVSDPNVNFAQTVDRYLGNKGDGFLTEFYPILYLLLLKYFFSFFGYVDDIGRIFSLIFGVLTIPLTLHICEKYFKIKNLWLPGVLVSCNLFLIWQSLEIRAHSILVFFVLLNILLFFEILKTNKLKISILYFLVSIFTLSLWPIAGAVFAGKFIFLIKLYFKDKIFLKHIYFLFLLIPIFYIILNIDYLRLNLARDDHYTKLYSSFFYNYHFRTFFGSIFSGGFFLLLFAYITLKKIKKIFFCISFENLFFYIIFMGYFLTLTYSLVRGAPIMSPKYVIFLVPLILILICNYVDKINFNKISSLIIIFVTFLNLYLNYFNWPIKRPDIKNIIKTLSKDESRILVSLEDDVFNNYIKNTKNFKKYKFTLFKKSELPKNLKNFWLVCQNFPRYAYGENYKKSIQKKCLKKFEGYEISQSFQTKDLYIIKFTLNES
jgi:hypothetical protein